MLPPRETIAGVCQSIGCDETLFLEELSKLNKTQSPAGYADYKEKKARCCTFENVSGLISGYYAARKQQSSLKECKIVAGDVARETIVYSDPNFLKLDLPAAGIESCLMDENGPKFVLPPEFLPLACKVFDGFLRDGVPIWNGLLYRLRSMSYSPELRLDYSIEDYFRYRLIYGLLGDEINEALIRADGDVHAVLDSATDFLPFREKLLPGLSSLDYLQPRCCCGGIGVLFAAARGEPYNDYIILLHVRSSKVSDNPNLLAVMPVGLHQPLISPAAEVGVYWSVLRETYEEIFGGEEPVGGEKSVEFDWFLKSSPPLQYLQEHEGSFTCELSNIGFYARAGEYEFNHLLVIHDEDFWRRFGTSVSQGWEAEQTLQVSSKDAQRSLHLIRREQWASESLFHFTHGLQRLKELDPLRVSLPDFQIVWE